MSSFLRDRVAIVSGVGPGTGRSVALGHEDLFRKLAATADVSQQPFISRSQ